MATPISRRMLVHAIALATTWSASAFHAKAASPPLNHAAEWQTVPGGEGTGCATQATPYEFYIHRGDPLRIAIHFQGGGACWNSRNCGLLGKRTFAASVDADDYPWLSGNSAGIFDLADQRNPVRDFTIVLVPYCSADAHIGSGSAHYESEDGRELDIQFRGLANSQRVITWVMRQYPAAQQIFVNGSSAGAIASPIFAAQLARHYTSARVVQLGDGAGGYRSSRIAALLDQWGTLRVLRKDPLFLDLDVATATFEDFYVRAGSVTNLQLAQVNVIEDAVQLYFLGELGHQVTKLAPLLSGNLAQLRSADSKLRTYTIPGTAHTVLQSRELYTTKVDGVPLATWLAELIEGKQVSNVGDLMLVLPAGRL